MNVVFFKVVNDCQIFSLKMCYYVIPPRGHFDFNGCEKTIG